MYMCCKYCCLYWTVVLNVYWTGVLYALDWCVVCTGLVCCMYWTGVLYVLDWCVVCHSHTWLHKFPVACFRTRGGGWGGDLT